MALESPWFWTEFVFAWWILFPIYAANCIPPLARGKRPLDGGRTLGDGRRILGDGKTVEGTALGLAAGMAVIIAEIFLSPALNAFGAEWSVTLPPLTLFAGLMLVLGAVLGDLGGSFIKRRLGYERGAKVRGLDRLNFILGALLLAYWFIPITPLMIAYMLILTPPLHRALNVIGHKGGVKQVPW
jgi:CDP-2,3-bis-(O-geranylgeranyl)-sn-glycerol synthase